MIKELKERYRSRFYGVYAVYTALETELLFFMVYDIVFFTEVKHLSLDQISAITFMSLLFSLAVQYPLLRWINHHGTRKAVRLGSLLFFAASIVLLFSDHFLLILFGAFLKCAGHTCNAMGPVLLKNRLKKEEKEDLYVLYQSDANSVTSLFMMATALLCGVFFRIHPSLPMAACSLFAFAGVLFSFSLSKEDTGTKEILLHTGTAKNPLTIRMVLLLIAFAIFTALTGTGLTYARMDIMKVLESLNSTSVVSFLTGISALIYLIRFTSNVFLRSLDKRIQMLAMLLVSALLSLGLLFLYLPWLGNFPLSISPLLLFAGYLFLAFVRDPFVTLTQKISLNDSDNEKQQTVLIALNTAKKLGSMALSALATWILKKGTIADVIGMMVFLSLLSLFLCLFLLKNSLAKTQEGSSSMI